MRNQINVFLYIFISVINTMYGQQIAITFDDAPTGDSWQFTGEQRTEEIIKKLKENKVNQAAFFCVTKHLDPTGKIRIDKYREAGHLIGNHSHSHSRISRLDIEGYIRDIATADSILSEGANFMKWFRFPFLDEGKTETERVSLRKALREFGYFNAYVTVDNYDWYLNSLFQKALQEKRKVNYEKLERFYIDHIWESILFYDEIAKRTLGRSPRHVLLLHENDLAALFSDKLIRHIRSKGWEIISPETAYEDEIATIIPEVSFNSQGRVAAIAYANGMNPSELVQESEDTDYLDRQAELLNIFE